MLGIATEVLDIHDGELLPTLENRRTITRLIREWNADIVMSHRPNDYHPDHRYTGVLVQDAAYMVTVPFFCPDVPPLKTNPVFITTRMLSKTEPVQAGRGVKIDSVIEKKLDALDALESQFYEGGANGSSTSCRAILKNRKNGTNRCGTVSTSATAKRQPVPGKASGILRKGNSGQSCSTLRHSKPANTAVNRTKRS